MVLLSINVFPRLSVSTPLRLLLCDHELKRFPQLSEMSPKSKPLVSLMKRARPPSLVEYTPSEVCVESMFQGAKRFQVTRAVQ